MGPNLIDLIKADHEQVKKEVKEILSEGATAPPESVDAVSTGIEIKETIRQFEAFSRDLLGVIKGVENVLYPKVLSDLPERIDEAKRDHDAIRILLQELGRPMGGVRVGDESWMERLRDLEGVVSSHFEREEKNILSQARDLLGSELLQELSFDYEEEKRNLPSEAGILPTLSAG